MDCEWERTWKKYNFVTLFVILFAKKCERENCIHREQNWFHNYFPIKNVRRWKNINDVVEFFSFLIKNMKENYWNFGFYFFFFPFFSFSHLIFFQFLTNSIKPKRFAGKQPFLMMSQFWTVFCIFCEVFHGWNANMVGLTVLSWIHELLL